MNDNEHEAGAEADYAPPAVHVNTMTDDHRHDTADEVGDGEDIGGCLLGLLLGFAVVLRARVTRGCLLILLFRAIEFFAVDAVLQRRLVVVTRLTEGIRLVRLGGALVGEVQGALDGWMDGWISNRNVKHSCFPGVRGAF